MSETAPLDAPVEGPEVGTEVGTENPPESAGENPVEFSEEITALVDQFRNRRPEGVDEAAWNSKARQLGRMLETSVADTPDSKQKLYEAWCRTHGAA
jgi:hypothetical protein